VIASTIRHHPMGSNPRRMIFGLSGYQTADLLLAAGHREPVIWAPIIESITTT